MTLPDPVDVAVTLLAGSGRAELRSGSATTGVPVFHALAGGGTPVLLARGRDLRALGLAATGEDVAAQLEVASTAPLPDVTLLRAHLSATGWLRARPACDVPELLGARCVAGDFGEAYRSWPDARLLSMELVHASLHWPFGCAEVAVDRLPEAVPDPLAPVEADGLTQIDVQLGGRLLRLVRAMGHAHGLTPGSTLDVGQVVRVRAVGLDRRGVVLRCLLGRGEAQPSGQAGGSALGGGPAPGGGPALGGEPALGGGPGQGAERNVRLPFPAPVSTVQEAVDTLALMVLEHESFPGGCPHAGPSPGAARQVRDRSGSGGQ